MSLRQVIANKKLSDKRAALEALRAKDEVFTAKSEELRTAIGELDADSDSYDDDFKTVSESADTHEAEEHEHNEAKSTLEEEIRTLEAELEELAAKAPDNDDTKDAARSTQNTMVTRGGDGMKMNRGFFKEMERGQVEELVQRDEVKSFLGAVRDAGQNRGVNNVNLTVPEVTLDMIRDNLHRYSKLISKVNVKKIKGEGRANVLSEIPEAIWTEMTGSINELELGFNQIRVNGYLVSGFVPVNNTILEDSDLNLANEVFDILGQAIGFALDKAILYGKGEDMPVGIVTAAAATTKPAYIGKDEPTWTNVSDTHVGKVSGDTPEKQFSELILFTGKAKANFGQDGKFYAMNETTYNSLKAKLVAFNASGAIVASINDTMPIIGGDIVVLPFIPDGDIVGGYGSQYVLADRAEMKLDKSEHVRFIENETVFKGTARYDGRPVTNKGFVVMNINGVAPTTTMAFAPDKANEEEVPEGV